MKNNNQTNKKQSEEYKCDILINKLNEKSNLNFKIISDTNQERPDFIIENKKNEKIGVEVVRIINEKTKQKEVYINKLINDLKEELNKILTPKYHISFSIEKLFSYNYDDLKKPSLLEELKSEIIDYYNTIKCDIPICIEDQLINLKIEIKYSEYKYITPSNKFKTIGSLVPKILSSNSFWSVSLPYEILKNTILNKEDKIEKYKENTKIETQWLLIVLDDGAQSTYSTFAQTGKLSLDFNSKFNEIFLLEHNELKYFNNNILESYK